MRNWILHIIAVSLLASACASGAETLTIYSGRSEELVGPLLERFSDESGVEVEVRYAGSTDLAATLREEGSNSPADVFLAQDPASLGLVALEGLLEPLPSSVLALVPALFSDDEGLWVGVSGRVRTVVYDTTKVSRDELPADIKGFTDPVWKDRLGVAPGNGSFLAFVAAMILMEGEEATVGWLEALSANDPLTYPKNSAIVAAVSDGEVDAGLVNHYYLLRRIEEQGPGIAQNYFFSTPTPGGLVMPAGVGVLRSTDKEESALTFVRFLLSESAQEYFAAETYEYPLVPGIEADPALPPLSSLNPPDLNLSLLAQALDRATDLVAEAGLL